MKTNHLTRAVCLALALPCLPALAQAQDANAQAVTQQPPRDTSATELDTVTVTGSRIPRAAAETASPVFTITADDIKKQGFRNVSDVLRAQPLATGSVQDNQSASNSFTAEATTISLLGLDPSFTLILMDGRPLADFPLLYNGQSNFTDLTSIPVAMIERIDILPGNQSSVYGSAAIAGVVNIILKKYLEGVQLDLRAGGYSEGGGGNERVQVTGGRRWDRLDLTWGLQYSHQDPIYMRQRDFTDTTDDNPNPDRRYGSRVVLALDALTGQYYDPGVDGCNALSGLYGGSVIRDFRPGRGYFCGSRAQPGYVSILNEEKGASAYFSGNYALGDDTDLYATLLVSRNKTVVDTGSRFWIPDYNNGRNGNIWNPVTGTLESYQHIFAPEEQGKDAGFYDSLSRSYSAAIGIKGGIGQSDWSYEAYYSRSGFKVTSDQWWPLVDEMDAFFRNQFMGQPLGTYYGYPIYEPNVPAMYQPITPEQFRSFSGIIHNESRTWTQNLNAQVVNPSLWQLPAGPVGVAFVAQAGNQFWDNPVDPGVSGDAYFGINATSGRGKRENQALGVEFSVPLAKKLNLSLAARYDRYHNVGANSDARTTYKVGLEFRPVETLLLRGNYGTAFRAPDMGYVFSGGNGFFTFETDYYKCEIDPDNCDQYTGVNPEGFQVSSDSLGSINAKSFGFGFIWSPSQDFDLHADYYNVRLSDKVVPQSTTRTLFDENECRQGRLDINSERCIDAISRVERTPTSPNSLISENVTKVTVRPINIADEQVRGIIAGANWRRDTRFGRFSLGLNYNLTLEHWSRTYPDDPVYDLFSEGQLLQAEFRSIVTGDLGWELGRWAVNVHGTRYGTTPNYARQFTADPADPYVTSNGVGPGKVRPWMVYNASVDFRLNDRSTISLIANNVLNARPPRDPSYDGSQGFDPPYYNNFAYNGYGRSFWLEYRIDFGQKM